MALFSTRSSGETKLPQPSRKPQDSVQPATAVTTETLWRFSLSFYARPGVADALLALQDQHGRDVNLILFALWCGAVHSRRLDVADVASADTAVAQLRGEIVEPLRQLRRNLKPLPDADIQELRRRVLGLELAAERAVQRRLAALAGPAGAHRDVERHLITEANLALYLGPEAAASLEAQQLRTALADMVRR